MMTTEDERSSLPAAWSRSLGRDDDQGLADDEQTLADGDQTSSDSDQFAADRDQEASDRDLISGTDAGVHERSRDIRLSSARERNRSAQTRLAAADARDASAQARDQLALARDHAAEARDQVATQRDAASADDDPELLGAEAVAQDAARRLRAAQQRARAVERRVMAARDRQASAKDREQAAAERLQALADREALARRLTIAETDALTGARTRGPGLVELGHELDRCRRTSGLLVVAYVDVVGLKCLNDTKGHSAGDELLVRVVTCIRQQLRSYDAIIRLGGDEFLCVMSNLTLVKAQRRFTEITGALAVAPGGGAISVGFATWAPDDTATEPDRDLLNHRGSIDTSPLAGGNGTAAS